MTRAFFDLRVWQKAQSLANLVYKTTKDFPRDELFGLTSQLRRAAVSVAANIAESHGRYHFRDRARILYISRAEIYEIRSHLRIAVSQDYITKPDFEKLDAEYDGLAIGINTLINSDHSRN